MLSLELRVGKEHREEVEKIIRWYNYGPGAPSECWSEGHDPHIEYYWEEIAWGGNNLLDSLEGKKVSYLARCGPGADWGGESRASNGKVHASVGLIDGAPHIRALLYDTELLELSPSRVMEIPGYSTTIDKLDLDQIEVWANVRKELRDRWGLG